VHVFDSLGISQFSTLRWTFFQDVIRSAAKGCHSIGIWRSKLDELGLDEACDLLHEMKLSVSSLSWCGGFTGSEGSSFALQIDDAIEAIAQAAALRAGCLVVHPGALNGHIRRHARRLLEEAFRLLLPVARDYGVRLALEPMPASSWTMLDGLEATLEFCEQFPADQVGLVWDLGHLGTDREAWAQLPRVLPRIAVVQLADRQAHRPSVGRCSLGQGSVPFRAWLNQFQNCGYRGPWEIETPCFGPNQAVNRCVLQPVLDFLETPQLQSQASWPTQL
jgi:sugar phosphate isomerase/epimerase